MSHAVCFRAFAQGVCKPTWQVPAVEPLVVSIPMPVEVTASGKLYVVPPKVLVLFTFCLQREGISARLVQRSRALAQYTVRMRPQQGSRNICVQFALALTSSANSRTVENLSQGRTGWETKRVREMVRIQKTIPVQHTNKSLSPGTCGLACVTKDKRIVVCGSAGSAHCVILGVVRR